MRRLVLTAVGVVTVAALGVGCSSKRAPGEASLSLNGRARLTSTSGKAVAVFRDLTVKPGQTLRITQGTGVLTLSSSRKIELRQGSAIRVDRTPSVLSGDALLTAAATPLTVRAAGTTVTLTQGAARLSRRLGIEAGTYRGTLRLSSAGTALSVPALREATIPSLGVVPTKPDPLRLRSVDAWDRRYLGEAIELTDQLQSRSDGLTGQLRGGAGRTAEYLTNLLPDIAHQSGFGADLVDVKRAPGETLVGASIAMAGRSGSFADRWRNVFSFRDDGAAWGLVALDQRVGNASALSSSIDAALGRAQATTGELASAVAAPPPTPATMTPPTTEAPEPSKLPSTEGSSGNGTGGGSRTPPPPTTQPPPTTPPAPPQGVLTPVVDTVNNLVGGLLSALGGGNGG